jgi:exodeoxyribonuclease VII large subunit
MPERSLFDAPAESPPVSVTELTQAVKLLLEGYPPFRGITVQAELGNFTRHSSGHWYFTLKDDQAQLTAVMFRQAATLNGFYDFKTGDRVQATGDVRVFAQRGQYQLVVQQLRPAGQGDLYARFLALKAKLQAIGLFDTERKRPPVPVPSRIAVITSPTGAVLQDICTTLARRSPYVHVVLVPAIVQGQDALPSLLQAFRTVAELPQPVDTVLLARGGGSLEDLWCFNEEALAHAIYQCPVPVISAVGHETDVTLADFVADVRAPTPTAAAELVATSTAQLLAELKRLQQQAARELQYRIGEQSMALEDLARQAHELLRDQLAELRAGVTHQLHALQLAQERRLQQEHLYLQVLHTRLQGTDTRAILARGFTLTLHPNGHPVRSARELHTGQQLHTRFADTTEAYSVVESAGQPDRPVE